MKIKISDNWKFINDYKASYLKELPKGMSKIDLPHTVKEEPYNYFNEESYQFVSTYFKEIIVKEDLTDKNVFIKFDGIMLKGHIYLNNKDMGNFISGYMPYTLDVTGVLTKGKNNLIVVVDSREDKSIPPFGLVVDYLTFGGIYRDVFLEIKPKKYIKDIYANGDMNGNLKIIYEVSENVTTNYKMNFKLYFDNKLISEFTNNEIKIDNPKLWDTLNPNLYTIVATLSDENIEDTATVRFGFRTAKFTTNGFYLNGNPLKLLGLNRHQAYPYVGYAMPKNSQEEDTYLLKKEIGVNLVRCSHYPPSDYFLDKCDELGLLVFDEVPGWQYIGKDEAWRNNFYDFIKRMVLKDRRFTSIIAYGVRIDESRDDHELYSKANEIVHTLDPFKATTGVRNFKTSELLEDVYSYNDFSSDNKDHGLDNPKTVKTQNKPYMVTECMGHMHPYKPFDTYEWRLDTTLRYARIIDDAYKYKAVNGVIAWCAFDYNTHKDFGSGDRICYHGVYDMYRNEKMTSYIYKAQQEEYPYFEVLSNMTQGDSPAAMTGYLYCATNADYIELYRNKEFINRFYPDKKDYPNTPHPLIKIDDFIGARFKEKMSEKDAKRMKLAINYVACNGYKKIPTKILNGVLLVALHNHLKFSDFYSLYGKYMQSWGDEITNYTIIAYKGNKKIATREIGPSLSWHLEAKTNTPTIELDGSYETSRVSIRLVDQFENLAIYSTELLNLKTTGPLEIIGPTSVNLIAGQISVYLKAKTVGKGTLIITSKDEEIKINIQVKSL